MKSTYTFIKFICTVVLILTNLNTMLACSCINITSFCETTFYNPNIAIVEVIGKSTPDDYSAFDVKVNHVISGTITEQELSINYNPTSCTEFIAVKIGDELIVNFDSTYDVEEAPYPAIEFGNCSVNFLTVKNNTVSGRIYGLETVEVPEDEFFNKLNECADLSFVDPENSLIQRFFRIIENPILSELNIETPTFINETFDISIYNNQGKLIKTLKDISGGLKSIDVYSFSSGLYFCTFKVRSLIFTKKFIKI